MTPTAEMVRETLDDPALFAEVVLGCDLWRQQQAILRSVAANRYTVVKSCHSSGKTHLAAAATLWWPLRYPDGIVVTTAPTWLQVETILWQKVAALAAGLRLPPQWRLNQTEFRLGSNNYAIGLSTDEANRFQGFHGGHVLVILDEWPGVRPAIWEAIQGVRAGGNVHVLGLGNPTVASGPFFDAFGKQASTWNRFTIDAFDTPNLRGLSLDDLLALPDDALDENARPYLTTRRWVREIYDQYGVDSPVWQARVRAEFPQQGQDALYPLAWLSTAELPAEDDGVEQLVGGLDIAGAGAAETALCLRTLRTHRIVGQWAWAQPDPRGAVLDILGEYRERLLSVNVDESGLGYYFLQHLRDERLPVRGVNFGGAVGNPVRFADRRAELYWGLRELLRDGKLSGWSDRLAIEQASGIRYDQDGRSRLRVDSKDELRRRGLASPDRLEAVILACLPALASAAPRKPGQARQVAVGQRQFVPR